MLPDVAGDELHAGRRGEGDTFGGGGDQDGLALMEGEGVVLVFMVGQGAAAFDAHYYQE